MSEGTITHIHQGCDFSDALLWRCGRTCAWAFVDPGVGGSTEGNLRLKVDESYKRRDEKSRRFSQRT